MAASWGVASFSGSSATSTNGVELNFSPSHVTEDTGSLVYSWQTNCGATVRTGPTHSHLLPIGTVNGGLAIDETQTLRREDSDTAAATIFGAFANPSSVNVRHSSFNDVGGNQTYHINNHFYSRNEQQGSGCRISSTVMWVLFIFFLLPALPMDELPDMVREDHETPVEQPVFTSTQIISSEVCLILLRLRAWKYLIQHYNNNSLSDHKI